MALTDRSYTSGRFALDIGGITVGYLKKFEGLDINAEVAVHDLGPDNVQKKHIAGPNKWTPGKASVGVGMGKGMYDWIRASFEKNYHPNHGALISADFDYKAQSRIDFEHALITAVTIPKLGGEEKGALYMDVEFETEHAEFSRGGGEDIRGKIGPAQKQWQASNFRVEIGGMPCQNVHSVDTFSWKCAVVADHIGASNRPTKCPAKVTVPNLKLEISMLDYQPWADFARKWFIDGERGEDTDEMDGRIVFLGPDRRTELGEIILDQVGLARFSQGTKEANSEKIARFQVELYVEKMTFHMSLYDA